MALAKYLRAESYRKGLAFQKQYLLGVVYSYEAGLAPPTLRKNRTPIKLTFRYVSASLPLNIIFNRADFIQDIGCVSNSYNENEIYCTAMENWWTYYES